MGSQDDSVGTPAQEDRRQPGNATRDLYGPLCEVAAHRNGVAHALTCADGIPLRVVTKNQGDRTAAVRGDRTRPWGLGNETDLPASIRAG